MNNFFTMIFGLVIVSAVCLADEAPASAPKNSGNDQTKRVINSTLMWDVIKPLSKKYKVHCKIELSDENTNKNPHWTCLNNLACSYRVTVGCFNKKGAHKQVLEIQVSGFDNGTESQFQGLNVEYLNP